MRIWRILKRKFHLILQGTVKYISQEENREFRNKSEEAGRMLNHKVENPKWFGLKIADCELLTADSKVQSIRKSAITMYKH